MSEIDIIFYSFGGVGTIIFVGICYKMCSCFSNARRRNIDNISNQITDDINSISLKVENCTNPTCSTFPSNTIRSFSLTRDKYTEDNTKILQTPPPSPVSKQENIQVYTTSNDVKEKYINMLISDYICNNNCNISESDIRFKYNNFRTPKDVCDFKNNM